MIPGWMLPVRLRRYAKPSPKAAAVGNSATRAWPQREHGSCHHDRVCRAEPPQDCKAQAPVRQFFNHRGKEGDHRRIDRERDNPIRIPLRGQLLSVARLQERAEHGESAIMPTTKNAPIAAARFQDVGDPSASVSRGPPRLAITKTTARMTPN